jgi:RNA polymerase sigma-70 factor (ECF subfamily)
MQGELGFVIPAAASARAWGVRVARPADDTGEQGSLADLMDRYARGEDRVFEAVYRVLAPRVRRFCRHLASSAAEADDLFQDTFLRLHRARATYVRGGNVLAWVLAIARSAHLDRLRYRRRRPEDVGGAADASDDAGLRAGEAEGPEAQAVARELVEVVSTALHGMSERNRLAYALLKEQGLSVNEAAAVLGTTTAVVRQRAHRAYVQVRAAVQSAGWMENTHERSHDDAALDL